MQRISALVVVLAAVVVSCGAPGPQGLVDDFNGESLNTDVWSTCFWWANQGCTIVTNHELEWYMPSQVSVGDGVLRLTADHADSVGSDGNHYNYVSGMVTTGPPDTSSPAKWSFTYGTVEARIRMPSGAGLWPGVWLLPTSRQSLPEIDIFEAIGSEPASMSVHLHPAGPGEDVEGSDYTLPGGKTFADGWHDLRLDWKPGRLTESVDGTEVWRLEGAAVPREPMYLIANLAVGGDKPGEPDDATRFPATFEIDSIRITPWTP